MDGFDLNNSLALVAKAINQGVVFTLPNGNVQWVNDSFLKLVEYERDEVVGNTLYELINGAETNTQVLARVKDGYINGHEFEEELIIHRKDGSWFWARIQGRPIVDDSGNFTVYFTVIEDISHRKFALEWLKGQEERYRGIIANLNLGLIEVDLNEKILFCNNSFCQMSGYTRDELIGKNAKELLLGNTDFETRKQQMAMRHIGQSGSYELKVKNKEGEERWWFISGAPLYNGKAELIGTIGVHLDITKQKQTEIELSDAKHRAEMASEAKQVFLANMSHEIRTPLNAVMGLSRQLQKSALTNSQKLQVDTIYNASENLLTIINDILDLSKIESGKLSVETIGFSLRDVISNCYRISRHKAEEKGLRFNLLIEDNIADVLMGDPYRLNQVLLNLLSNSIKFTEKGSVKIMVELREELWKQQTIELSVIDTGIGMSNQFLENIFTGFTQEDASITRLYGGSGLGLNITKQLVNLMGGEIYVESKKNIGTKFSVIIPFKVGTTGDMPVKAEKKIDYKLFKDRKILIVDDNEYNRMVAKTTLEHYGCITEECEDGISAIKKVESNKYDLILMDLRMPDIDGREATVIIRNELKVNTPVIALTANAISGENEKCLAAGMNDFISKPFVEDEFIATVSGWLDGDVTKPNEHKLYDLTELYDLGRDSDEFVAKMISIFIKQLSTGINEMVEAKNAGDVARVGAIAHRLKPSIKSLKVGILDELLQLEKYKGTPDSSHYTYLVEQVHTISTAVITELKKQFAETVEA